MDDLFEDRVEGNSDSTRTDQDQRQNLAARMRPSTWEEFVGQSHLTSPHAALRQLVETGKLHAALFYGPPGTGKTSLARIIGKQHNWHFVELSGVETSVQRMREVIEQADTRWRARGRATCVLIDEIHRLNKAQQDALLPHVERGAIRLIGATTENPFFYINSALTSRAPLFEFKTLGEKDIETLLRRAVADSTRGLNLSEGAIEKDVFEFLATWCEGDARRALGALEMIIQTHLNLELKKSINLADAEETLRQKALVYDKKGDQHYDTLSAFIKSIRASEPDSAIYWLAKMIEGGEDVRIITRRLVISAAEDIGLADPAALPLAVACQQTIERIGMPEGRIPLAETTIYLATAAKSNSAYMAIDAALSDIRSGRTREVPIEFKDASYASAKKLGHGKGYIYPHATKEGIAPEVSLKNLPAFYKPTTRGYEKTIAERLERWQKKREELRRTNEPN